MSESCFRYAIMMLAWWENTFPKKVKHSAHDVLLVISMNNIDYNSVTRLNFEQR
jgi:hypothetical protein